MASTVLLPPDTESDTPRSTTESARFGYLLVLFAAFAVVGVVGGGVYYLNSSVAVEISVDGSIRSVDSRAETVADLLAAEGIEFADGDHVAPSLGAKLVDGTVIDVRHARDLTVVVDGVETTHRTTELTVRSALAAVGRSVEGAAVSVPLNTAIPRSGASVDIVTAKSVTLDDGGTRRSVTSTARTVADLLESEGITTAPTDTVAPTPDTEVRPDMTVVVTRITIENETTTEAIAHDTTERNDDSLTVGTRKVVTEGVDGEQEVVHATTYANGKATVTEVISTTVTREPVTEVVAVGTKPKPAAPAPAADPGASPGGEAAGLNWAALANCESSGNPKAVNPAGYYGLYQFSLRTWASVGGSGNPVDASPAEQLKRAQILYNKAGVGQWPHCGPRLYD